MEMNFAFKTSKLKLGSYQEYILFLLYAAGLALVQIPSLHWDLDWVHHPVLLMSSLRIWEGQVPFRDFYPWYGPLYHYLLALFAGLLGNDIYAVKFFIHVVSPLLCMGLLLMSLRMLKLPACSRLFIAIATVALGLERNYYSGSLRSFLAVFFVALWFQGFEKRKWPEALVMFPSATALYFFSSEAGVFLGMAALVFSALGILLLENRGDRFRLLSWSAAGLVFSLAALSALYLGTIWARNYFAFASSLTREFNWSYGLSRPDWDVLWREPSKIYYYLPLVLHTVAALYFTVSFLRHKHLPDQALWIAPIISLGMLFWASSIVRGGVAHLQFCYPFAAVIAGLAWTGPFKPLRLTKLSAQIILIILLLAGTVVFVPRRMVAFKNQKYAMLLGVRVSPHIRANFDHVRIFAEKAGLKQVAFPIDPLFYAELGQIPPCPFDSLYYVHIPLYKSKFLEAMQKLDAGYIIIDEESIVWDWVGESVDMLMDFIDENYETIYAEPPLRVFRKRNSPARLTELVSKDQGPFLLDEKNHFKLKLAMPEIAPDYLEFKAQFEYRPEFLCRFSMPIIEVSQDGRRWRRDREQEGRQRISPLSGEHNYRLYFLYPARQLEIGISFPGAFNFSAAKVSIRDVQWHRLLKAENAPRFRGYELEGEEKTGFENP
jgi:hypothetical protein